MNMSPEQLLEGIHSGEPRAIARAITLVEDNAPEAEIILAGLNGARIAQSFVLGITGPPGAGKSTLTNRLISHYRDKGERTGVIAIDPSSSLSGGAFLGDRVRMMQHAVDRDVVIRSMATRGRLGGLCSAAGSVARIMAASGCVNIIIETVGVGQSEMDIIRLADVTALVLAPGLGDDIQAMKAGLLEVADILVVNKADSANAEVLAMELEKAVRMRPRGNKYPEIIKTSAMQNDGIKEFAEIIASVHEKHRQSGELKKRRNHSFELEVLDWALALMRPEVRNAMQTLSDNGSYNVRKRAMEILEKIGLKAKE